MKIISLALCFTKDRDTDFLQRSQYIHGCMSGNPFFPTPTPTLPNLSEAIAIYSQSLTDAAGKGEVLVAQKDQNRQILEEMLGELGLYVMLTALGNVAALISSGFTLVKERGPRYIVNPGNVTLVNGVTSGQIESRVKNQRAARSYLHQITDSEPIENTVWDSRTVSTCKYMFNGLLPGKRYWIRVAVVGPGNQVAYSSVSSMYAQ